MSKRQPFEIVYHEFVTECLDWVESRDIRSIRETIEEQLSWEPLTTTRNRKKMKKEAFGQDTWELRFAPYRIIYETDADARIVTVLALGVKQREKFLVAGKELKEYLE